MLKRAIMFLLLLMLLTPVSASAKKYLIVLDDGDDNIRITSRYRGPTDALAQLRRNFGARTDMVAVTVDQRPNPINRYLTEGYDLIIGVGIRTTVVVNNSAVNNKYQQYALVDTTRGNLTDNATGFAFAYAEAGYVAGFMAAKMSQSGSIGFIGGERLTQTLDFSRGFRDGAQAANPDIKIRTTYLNDFFDAYAARSRANEMYRGGADVVCHLAGPGGQGVVEAAQNSNKWCITVDVSGGSLPKNVLASVVMDYDRAVVEACRMVENGQFAGGRSQLLNIGNEGIAIRFSSAMPAAVKQAAQKLSRDIADGKVLVRNNDSRVIN